VNTVLAQGNKELCLLKCSSAYPAVPDDMNLRTIQNLKNTFNIPVGLSDHSIGSIGAVTAVAMGANVIEKHFCISREIENPDAFFSMEPLEFKKMIEDIRTAEKAMGEVSYRLSEQEKNSRLLRKSIFIVTAVKKGEVFTDKNLRVIRPGYGLEPKYYDEILGKMAAQDIEEGTPLDWGLVK
jgi:pseudaminic acid synthase